jgi:hypothetical protein
MKSQDAVRHNWDIAKDIIGHPAVHRISASFLQES